MHSKDVVGSSLTEPSYFFSEGNGMHIKNGIYSDSL